MIPSCMKSQTLGIQNTELAVTSWLEKNHLVNLQDFNQGGVEDLDSDGG